MQTITIEILENQVLNTINQLQESKQLRVIKTFKHNSLALPGEPTSIENFQQWIEYSNNLPTVSLANAQKKWQKQKEKLQKLID